MIDEAIEFATQAHRGQRRKYTNLPYIIHPLDVARLVMEVRPDDDEMIVAAILHDVVEDCQIPIETIEALFNQRVMNLVSDLTDISKPEDGNRYERKAKDLQHTAQAHPDAKTIKLADLLDNTKDIEEHDGDFAKVYMREKAALLEVLKEGDSLLWLRAHHRVLEFNRKAQ